MATVLLLLAIIVWLVSLARLIYFGTGRYAASYALLIFLHILIGAGYLYIPVYRHWEFGEMYFSFTEVSIGLVAISYVFALTVALAVLSTIHLALDQYKNGHATLSVKRLSTVDILVGLVLTTIYIAGLFLQTLSSNGSTTSLPLRLNGIIEITTLLLVPIYITLRTFRIRGGIWLALSIIGVYSLFNVAFFGTKQTAILPMVIIMLFHVSIRPFSMSTLRMFLTPFLLIMALYIFLNPFHFQANTSGFNPTEVWRVLGDSKDVSSAGKDPLPKRIALGTRNLAVRVIGVLPMQYAIDESAELTAVNASPRINLKVHGFYNTKIRNPGPNSSHAVGHMAYFMFLFRNHLFGFIVGLTVIGILYWVVRGFDNLTNRHDSFFFTLLGMTLILTSFGFLTDGTYTHVSLYLHVIGGLIGVALLSMLIIDDPKVEEYKVYLRDGFERIRTRAGAK